MKKQTARIIIGIAINVMLFVAIAFAAQEDFELWQYIAIWGTITIFNSILILWENPEHKPRTIVIKVKAWDNQEVRIRELTASEKMEVIRLDAMGRWRDGARLAAFYAIVESNKLKRKLIYSRQYRFGGVMEVVIAAELMAKGERERS